MPYIYKITNKINDKCYIGKTCLTIQERFKQHCSDCLKRNEEHRPLYKAMQKYGFQNFSIELIEECDVEKLSDRETYWINYYNSYHYGYNATYGGDGTVLYDYSKIYDLWKSGITQAKIAQILNCDAETIANALNNYNVSHQERLKQGRKAISKSVLMINKTTNEVIQIFSSTREAAKHLIKEFNLNPLSEGGYSTHISEVCRGKRKTCNGFKWKYADC
jgi:group I intron endonuclease